MFTSLYKTIKELKIFERNDACSIKNKMLVDGFQRL